jgi:hypothetical protein
MNQALFKSLSSCLKRITKSQGIIALLFLANSTLSASNFPLNSPDSVQDNCKVPIYAVGGTNVSSSKTNDGKILIHWIKDATHYEIIGKQETPFDFNEAIPLEPGQREVEIRGLINPNKDVVYKIRLYNGSESCYTDQSVHLSHINFAEKLEYTQIEVIQGVDNPSPKIGDIVTFTTIVQNKGSKIGTNIELKQFYTPSLELIYYFSDIGAFTPVGNVWQIGDLPVGKTPKLIVRARVTEEGLSYLTSYLSKANGHNIIYGQPLPTQDNSHAIAATNCVSVPINLKKDDVYRISLQKYKGLTWYYKDAAGNFSDINEFTNPAIAEVNADSSLSIKQPGEYTYIKKVGACTFNSCCSVIIEGCKGPPIIVDSVYCNTTVDSYSMVVHLENDNWSIVEKVYYALSNLSFPVLTNFLRRLNVLPLTASSGYVTSLGGGYYRIDNVPAFMPNVTLVSTDISGACRNVKIVNAPNCQTQAIAQPLLASTLEYFSPSGSMPALRVRNAQKGYKTVWYADELGITEISKGNMYQPDGIGKYYVAFVDKRTKSRSLLVEAEIKDNINNLPGEFINVSLCECNNTTMLPEGSIEDFTLAKIYPNPVDNLLSVEYLIQDNGKTADMFVFNISGQQMGTYVLDIKGNNMNVNVSRWPDGLYLMTLVVDGEKKLTNRFVIRH